MLEVFRKIASSWAMAVVLAAALSILFVVSFGYSAFDIDGVRLGFSVSPSLQGETELAIPPFGEITARTHKTPVSIQVVLEKIYLQELSQFAEEINNSKELVQKVEFELKEALKQFLVRLILFAAIGGAIGGALSPKKRLHKALAGSIVGASLIGALLLATHQTYNIHAFKQPRYSGALQAAPWATEGIAKRLADIKAFREEILNVARNVDSFYSKIEAWQPLEGDTIKVLHVSDIHNNTLAVDLINRLVKDFNIDLVIDTGDITDFGTPVENTLVDGIASLPVPYVFVPGNHDSPETVAFLQGVENVTVLDGTKIVDVKGIRIFGMPDPTSTESEIAPASDSQIKAHVSDIEEALESLPERPHVIAVHNPKAASELIGKAPTVLTGHTHKAGLIERDGNIMVNAGTTGAAGLRTFQAEEGVPYTLSIIHLDRSTKKIIAVDSIEMVGIKREFRLERNLIEGEPAPEGELETLDIAG